MSLNISNLLNTLKGYYDPDKTAGERYNGGTEGLNTILTESGLSETIEKALTSDNLSTNIFENGLKITVSSESANKFSYKIDNENGKIIVFGNNLTITVDEENECMVEVVGISNVINATSKSDNINLIGYDNEINAGGGEDEVIIYGDDNKNIFSGVSGNTLIVNDKKFEIQVNGQDEDTTAEITVNSSDTGRLSIDAQNAKIFVQEANENDYNDNISLKGDNNYLDTGDGTDDISVEGDNNIIITGDDELRDTVEINGKNNEVSGDENDIVTYTASSGSIVLTNSDKSQHYIKVGDFEYYVQRNTDLNRDVTLSYELTSTGTLEFKGDYFKLIAVKDGVKDDIKVLGNYNYIDTGDEDDLAEIVGNYNQIHAGEGDDRVTAVGDNNELYGDTGTDYYAVDGKNNLTEDFEGTHKVVTLNAENPGQTVQIGDNKYIFKLTKAALKDIETLGKVVVTYLVLDDDTIEIKADNVVISSYGGQKDKINFIGSNSKIYTGNGTDKIAVKGDNNAIDGGSGNDTISVLGLNNKALGFLGDDEINVVQRELTESELNAELKKISDEDENRNKRTRDEKIEMVNSAKANNVDGEFDIDTVNTTSKYTQISKETEIYKSLTQSIKLDPKDDEKKIIVTADDGSEYSYTIKNYATEENNNPFVSTRTISYDIIDGQLVVKGNYISVVADDGQNDNIKIIGSNNFLDMGDGADTIYADENCHYNLIFGGIGKDYINVKGNNNNIYGDSKYDMKDTDDSDTIIVEGKNNTVSGGRGNDDITVKGDNFRVFGNEGNDKVHANVTNSEIHGGNATEKAGNDTLEIINTNTNTFYDFNNMSDKEKVYKIALSNKNRTQEIKYKDVDGKTVTFKVEPNILSPQKLSGEIWVDYHIEEYNDDNGTHRRLVITGNNISVNLTNGSDKSVNVKLIGDDCRLETFGGADNIEIIGNKNKVIGGDGANNITVNGNSNEIEGGKDKDIITVTGNDNNVIRNGSLDKITLKGINNKSSYYDGDDKIEGSTVLTKDNNPQIVVIKNKAYKLFIYGIPEENAQINVEYHYYKDEKSVLFCGTGKTALENVKIVAIDDSDTPTADEKTADNKDSLRLRGNNCYISGGYGDDKIVVEGNNNVVDGWTGDDTLNVIGNNNEVRGFNGNDTITIEGNENFTNGEQGTDTIIIKSGTDNTYKNVEIIKDPSDS